jgi:ABC-type sugar transport system substrate-binding protein
MRVQSLTAGKPRRSAAIVVIAAATLVTAFAAPGASGKPAQHASATAAPGLTEANAAVAAAQKRPTSIGLSTPVGKPIPKGKKIVYISCAAIQACTVHIKFINAAAKALGWTASMITTDGSPQQVQAAFDSALRSGADGIISTGITRANLEKQILDAKAKGVPFATCCTLAPVSNGIIYSTSTKQQNGRIGKYLAAKVVSDTGATGGAVYVNLSAYEILAPVGTSFETWYKKWCPSCEYDSIDIPLSALGKNVPDTIVSFLRSHPSVNYIVLSEGDALAPGLTAALRAAGLNDKVKVVAQGPGLAEFQEIREGTFGGGVPFDFVTIDWLMVDAIARSFAGVPVKLTAPPLWLVTKANVPNTSGIFPIVADYKAKFLKLWGKKK